MTGLLLGMRHGIDWDHIAAITDITSTAAAAGSAEAAHDDQHRTIAGDHHGHGGAAEMRAHDSGPGTATLAPIATMPTVRPARFGPDQVEAIRLGTLYALGHGAVVIALGLAALWLGATPPRLARPDHGPDRRRHPASPSGSGCSFSVYRYARGGTSFRLRSRWMLVFDGVRYGWRQVQARLHGHEHVEPLEMSSYGTRTAFGVGMIHGVGAETGTQVLLIAAVGGAAERRARRPDAAGVRRRAADLQLRRSSSSARSASWPARPASGLRRRSAASRAASAW